jgi:transcriptional regulator
MPLGFSFAYYRLNELLDISEYVQKKTDKSGIKNSYKSIKILAQRYKIAPDGFIFTKRDRIFK